MHKGRWRARIVTALFSAIWAPLLSFPIWRIVGILEQPILVGAAGALAGGVAGIMATGVTRAVVGNRDADRLCLWCVATGVSAAMAIAPAGMGFLGSRVKDPSYEVVVLLVAGFAFTGALIGGVRAK